MHSAHVWDVSSAGVYRRVDESYAQPRAMRRPRPGYLCFIFIVAQETNRFKNQEEKNMDFCKRRDLDTAGFVENKRCEKREKYLTGDARTEHNILY